jgi:putative Holliday junction resolvase
VSADSAAPARAQSVVRPRAGTVLALDYGARRIGVAVGELELGIAHPLETIHAESERAHLQQIERLIREWSPVLLIVGLPSHMDGAEHELSKRCRTFAQELERRFEIETRLVDERLTSNAASQSLADAGVRGRRQKSMRDQVAAQHILETFFSLPHDAA